MHGKCTQIKWKPKFVSHCMKIEICGCHCVCVCTCAYGSNFVEDYSKQQQIDGKQRTQCPHRQRQLHRKLSTEQLRNCKYGWAAQRAYKMTDWLSHRLTNCLFDWIDLNICICMYCFGCMRANCNEWGLGCLNAFRGRSWFDKHLKTCFYFFLFSLYWVSEELLKVCVAGDNDCIWI